MAPYKKLKGLYHKKREHAIKEFKSNIFINVEGFQRYESSDFVKNIIGLFNKLDKDSEEAMTTLQDAIDVRDHLILTVTFINALRASNIINITLKEVEAANKHDEFDKYKTSLIYGAKVVLIPSLIYHHVKLYINT